MAALLSITDSYDKFSCERQIRSYRLKTSTHTHTHTHTALKVSRAQLITTFKRNKRLSRLKWVKIITATMPETTPARFKIAHSNPFNWRFRRLSSINNLSFEFLFFIASMTDGMITELFSRAEN